MLATKLRVDSPNVRYEKDAIVSSFDYRFNSLHQGPGGETIIRPTARSMSLKTDTRVPKVGLMMVGWGGSNGSCLTAGIIANREGITWRTAHGVQRPNWFGSVVMSSTFRLGSLDGREVFVPFHEMVPMLNPSELVIGGWDISGANLAAAMERAQVIDYDLQRQLVPFMKDFRPLPAIYIPDFIAANQSDRADNVLGGTKQEMVDKIRKDIRDFRERTGVDKVIVLWTATTERFAEVMDGVNDTAENLLAAIARSESEIAPSTLYAVASILEGCNFINGSPQNTLVPGAVELAETKGVYVCGDDFKTGQTKLKSVLVDFLVSSGIKPVSIVSYNHLGNNDGKNLSAPQQFRSKEISKSNVVDDMVAGNPILYRPGEHPDHTVVIKYVPYVGDSKRALDEYTSQIFLGGHNTIVIHNTCEDSLLAAPVMLDLVILSEMMSRVSWKTSEMPEFEKFDAVLSILGFLLKAPMVPEGTPVINALFKQRACLENFFRACIGLEPESHMMLEFKVPKSHRAGFA